MCEHRDGFGGYTIALLEQATFDTDVDEIRRYSPVEVYSYE